jgi:hypothetical protein
MGSLGGSEVLALAAQALFSHPLLYRLPASIPVLKLGEMVYHSAGEPRSISATAAAILPWALRMDADEIKQRRSRAQLLQSRMAGAGAGAFRAIRPVTGGEPGYLRFALLDAVGNASPDARLGAVRGYPLTLDQHDQLRPILARGESSGPGAQDLRDRLFTVPTHSAIGKRDVEALAAWLIQT